MSISSDNLSLLGLSNIEEFSEKPIFSEIFETTPLPARAILQSVNPIVRQYLKDVNYDRIDPIIQYIRHHKICIRSDPSIRPLQSLASFQPDIRSRILRGSSCFGHRIDFLSLLPSHIKAYPVAAGIFKNLQQEGWPLLTHTTPVIPYSDPANPEDSGYVLLDPVLKAEQGIVMSSLNPTVQQNLKEKGMCSFSYQGETIVCRDSGNLSMTYYLKNAENFTQAYFKPILAGDRKIIVYSREETGRVKSYLILLLNTKTIRYSIQSSCYTEISFDQFLLESVPKKLSDLLRVDQDLLDTCIREIVFASDLLDTLHIDYLEMIKNSRRNSEFYFPD